MPGGQAIGERGMGLHWLTLQIAEAKQKFGIFHIFFVTLPVKSRLSYLQENENSNRRRLGRCRAGIFARARKRADRYRRVTTLRLKT